MLVVLVALAVGAVVGTLTAGLTWRWPFSGPMAPRLHRHAEAREVTAAALVAALLVTIVGVTAFGLVLLMVRTKTGLERFDESGARFAFRHSSSGSTRFLRLVTDLGDTVGVTIAAVVVAIVDRVRTRHLRAVPFLLVAILGVSILANSSKLLFDRARPNLDQLVAISSTSFPSGHAATSAGAWAAFALVLSRGTSRRGRTALGFLAGFVAGLVAASRVLLGVHWITDVTAGASFGWAWFALSSVAFGGRLLRFGDEG